MVSWALETHSKSEYTGLLFQGVAYGNIETPASAEISESKGDQAFRIRQDNYRFILILYSFKNIPGQAHLGMQIKTRPHPKLAFITQGVSSRLYWIRQAGGKFFKHWTNPAHPLKNKYRLLFSQKRLRYPAFSLCR